MSVEQAVEVHACPEAHVADVEEWRPVVGWEGMYEVSSKGRVRSIPRVIPTVGPQGRRVQRHYRVLRTPQCGSGGYPTVNLARSGDRQKVQTVHTLVLTAFVGPRPDGMEGCHGDGDPTNNRRDNLRWDSQPANGLDRTRHGRDHKANRTHCPRGHRHSSRNNGETAAKRAKGWRKCKACKIADSVVARAKSRGKRVDFEEEADRQYRRIMGDEAL